MNYKKSFFKFILGSGDIILMYFSILLALAIRENDFSFLPGTYTRLHLFYFSFIFIIWLFFLILLDFYEIPPLKNIFNFFSNLTIFFLIAFATGSVFFYLQPTITPKTILFLNILILCLFIFSWRLFFNLFLKIINFKEKIIIVGSRPELKEINSEILQKNKYQVIEYLTAEVLGSSLFREEVKKCRPDFIVLALEHSQKKDLIKENFSNFPLGFNYINFKDFYEELLKKVLIDSINEAWFLENFRTRGRIHLLFERSFDIFFSLLGILMSVILFPFIALAIKLSSPGSIFYKQKRVGQGGKIFTLYKFRTMYQNAEENGAQWAKEDDPRMTLVGRFLRAVHIDEFPQFYNILKGDISFVGPRPERPEFVEQLKVKIPFYNLRHLIKPGLTGWAQIHYKYGSSSEDAQEKLKYDLFYIKHHLALLDLGIILKTVSMVIRIDLNKLVFKFKRKKESRLERNNFQEEAAFIKQYWKNL